MLRLFWEDGRFYTLRKARYLYCNAHCNGFFISPTLDWFLWVTVPPKIKYYVVIVWKKKYIVISETCFFQSDWGEACIITFWIRPLWVCDSVYKFNSRFYNDLVLLHATFIYWPIKASVFGQAFSIPSVCFSVRLTISIFFHFLAATPFL